MAHFAKIENNQVVQIIVIRNDDCGNSSFPESEPAGQKYIKSIGIDGIWIQTSYNGNFRKKFAGLGFFYDKNLDAFIEPKPYPSWILNKNTVSWEPPVEYPPGEKIYNWNEDLQKWVESIIT